MTKRSAPPLWPVILVRARRPWLFLKLVGRACETHSGAIIAIFTACLFASTTALWWETKNLRADSYIAFEAAQRPWVAVEMSIMSDLTYNESGDAEITIRFTMRNVGHSPAVDVLVIPTLFMGSSERARAEREKSCEGLRKRPPADMGQTLFPGQTSTQDVRLSFTRQQIIQANKSLPEPYVLALSLIGCVDYRVMIARRDHHQTTFQAELLKPNTSGGLSVIAVDEGRIAASSMRLVRFLAGELAD